MLDNYVLRANLQTLQFQAALVEISRAGAAGLDNALARISTLAADALETARVSIWLFNDDHTELRCLHLFDRERNTHESGAILEVGKYPRYFKALEESRTIPAEVARTHPCTSEFAVGYLDVLNIVSMLDVPIRREGRVVGVLCNEHSGPPRTWRLASVDLFPVDFVVPPAHSCSGSIPSKHREDHGTMPREYRLDHPPARR